MAKIRQHLGAFYIGEFADLARHGLHELLVDGLPIVVRSVAADLVLVSELRSRRPPLL